MLFPQLFALSRCDEILLSIIGPRLSDEVAERPQALEGWASGPPDRRADAGVGEAGRILREIIRRRGDCIKGRNSDAYANRLAAPHLIEPTGALASAS